MIALDQNEKRIIKTLLRTKKPINRTQICNKCELAWTTAYDTLIRLMQKGLVKRTEVNDGKKGRNITLYHTNLGSM